MDFSVQILGCGSALPTVDTHQSAQVVEVGQDLFLIDCGEGTQVELRRNKVKIQKISQVFISHLHGDHFFGLVGLLSTMHLLGRKKKLEIYGPAGLKEIVLVQFKTAGSYLSFEMEFHEILSADQLLFESKYCTVRSLPLKHRVTCYGFLVQQKPGPRKLIPAALLKHKVPNHARKSITEGADFIKESGERIANSELSNEPAQTASYAYCSDTAYCEDLIPFIKGLDLLYHEATFLEQDRKRAKTTFHSCAKDAAKIARLAGVKKLILGHMSNRYKDLNCFVEEAMEEFNDVSLAEEGKIYSL